MKTYKLQLFLLFLFMCMTATAQNRFGYIAFNNSLRLMPEYMEAELQLQKLQSDYKEEIERAKREFDRQYTDFIINQNQLSATIVAKRQKELQLLMDNNVEFKNRAAGELEVVRNNMLDPLKGKLLDAIKQVCDEMQLDWVIDTEKGTYLYINNDRGIDISHPVYQVLGIESQIEPTDTLGKENMIISLPEQ